ncbi:MAG: DNA polymerase III subunit epsilon [Pseudomonadales bacterium]|nr:DNA polymerase III subunit epsilon [Pseudomonadales bacterium]
MNLRQVVLDTETTGIDPLQGHRIIEIGCVELENRRFTGNTYHEYINPEREIEAEAISVHGITNESLEGKPLFADVASGFIEFIRGAELIIHNAPFDVGFLNNEFALMKSGLGVIADYSGVLDTLAMARKRHPGQRNSLDALCKRYGVDNSKRELHGALLDAEILADVYLLMTGGQLALSLGDDQQDGEVGQQRIRRLSSERPALKVIKASDVELKSHQQKLEEIQKISDGCLWLQ